VDITILAYLEPGDAKPDVVMDQVAAGLKAAGHQTSILTLRHDVNEVVEGLKKHKPDLVFNLVESFGHDILGGVIGVAGLLDLLQVPYTGGGPGEIFLQEDKALSKKLLAFESIPYPDFATFTPNADFETGGNLRMPLFVKPLRMDASIGIDGITGPVAVRPRAGELSTFTDLGYSHAFAVLGLHRWFHTVEDTLGRVDAKLVVPVLRAHQRTIELIVGG